MTRAQVQQELAAARANGELVSGEEGYAATTFASSADKTRAQVQRELAAARAQGLTGNANAENPARARLIFFPEHLSAHR